MLAHCLDFAWQRAALARPWRSAGINIDEITSYLPSNVVYWSITSTLIHVDHSACRTVVHSRPPSQATGAPAGHQGGQNTDLMSETLIFQITGGAYNHSENVVAFKVITHEGPGGLARELGA